MADNFNNNQNDDHGGGGGYRRFFAWPHRQRFAAEPPPPPAQAEAPVVVEEVAADPPPPEAAAPPAPGVAVPEHLQIQDLDEWLRINGLPQPSSSPNNDDDIPPTLDRMEERERFREFERYEKSIHESIFAKEMQQDKINQQEREKQLHMWQNVKMNFLASNGHVVKNIPLQPMAASCETIFTMASCRQYFYQPPTDTMDDDNGSGNDKNKMNHFLFSLDDFTESSIRDFVSVVLGKQQVENLTPDSIVENCQISHYVQNSNVFDATVKILLASIDTGNCLSLCYLADKLNIPILFERSVGHLMHTVGSLENGCCWQDLTIELQNRILAIKHAIQSSIHDQRRTLYFASLDEYIAIFAERCQYYRERLAEAKEQQQEMMMSTCSSSYCQDVHDKIARQERRVHALEIALAEQKKLFSSVSQTTA